MDRPSCHLSHTLSSTLHAVGTHVDISAHKLLQHDSQSSDASEPATALDPPWKLVEYTVGSHMMGWAVVDIQCPFALLGNKNNPWQLVHPTISPCSTQPKNIILYSIHLIHRHFSSKNHASHKKVSYPEHSMKRIGCDWWKSKFMLQTV